MTAYVPLLQTLVWPVFLAVLVAIFRSQVRELIEAFRKRIERSSKIKTPWFEINDDLKALDYASPSDKQQPGMEQWEQERTAIYRDNHGLFLVHVVTPSQKRGQKYDIFIYLIRHKTSDLSDVEYAEFFLGHMWGNRVFREEVKEGMIGMSTSAYGPFLCICRAHLRDGSVVKLDRYIDFEMGDMLYEASK